MAELTPKEQAYEVQQKFTYEQVVNTEDVKIWRCGEPGTNIYRFELVVTKYSIYMSGDIGQLVWPNIGSRGLSFLAGLDVEYYICSKLALVYQDNEIELDIDSVNALIDNWSETYDGAIPDTVREEIKEGIDKARCSNKHELYEGLSQIYAAVYNETGDFELSLTRPSYSLMFRVYMCWLAARRILGLETQE